jgi:hypothetical protein
MNPKDTCVVIAGLCVRPHEILMPFERANREHRSSKLTEPHEH